MIILFVGPEMVESRLSGFSFQDKDGVKSTGEIGDLFSGTTGPLIAIIGCVLTFIAFYIQYQANKEQRLQFRNQGLDTARERFENRYFEMIRLHRANVEELDIQDVVKGRKAFTPMYFEFKYIYVCLEKQYVLENGDVNSAYVVSAQEKDLLTHTAYLIFFFGINESSNSVYINLLPKNCKESYFIETINELRRIQKQFDGLTPAERALTFVELAYIYKDQKLSTKFLFVYRPFAGQGQKLGHYFRHLYRTVKYVNDVDDSQMSLTEKKDYLVILRAQLSNFEQILLYYNCCSVLGSYWLTSGLLFTYRMIKNMPLAFVDFGIYPEEKFSEEQMKQLEFDWYELNKLVNK